MARQRPEVKSENPKLPYWTEPGPDGVRYVLLYHPNSPGLAVWVYGSWWRWNRKRHSAFATSRELKRWRLSPVDVEAAKARMQQEAITRASLELDRLDVLQAWDRLAEDL